MSFVGHQIEQAARRTGLTLLGAGCAIVAAALLGWSLWAWLAIAVGVIAATALTGGILALIAAVILALAHLPHRPKLPPPPAPTPYAAMLTAFVQGLQAGRSR